MKRLLVISISVSVLLTLLLILGCGKTIVEPESNAPESPVKVNVSFPDGAPPLNQAADLVCIIDNNYTTLSLHDMSVNITLSDGFKLISGELSWLGDITEGAEVEVIRAVIKSVKVGHWTIDCNGYLDHKKHGGFGMNGSFPIYVSVSEDSAEWAYWPIRQPGDPPPLSLKVSDKPSPKVDLSISHLPLVNEWADLTCSVSISTDYPNVIVQIRLPDDGVEVDGDIEWQGDLEADIPVAFSTKILFKRSGRFGIGWNIQQTGNDWSWYSRESICLNIDENESSFCEELIPILPPPP